MLLEFDDAKDRANRVKHGVGLDVAASLEWDTLWAKPDTRRDYGETRCIGYALCADRLYCVVYTERGEARRIISLRRANPREVLIYAENH
ncbi:MAG: BrnT family toxin [Rhodoferax sp.]